MILPADPRIACMQESLKSRWNALYTTLYRVKSHRGVYVRPIDTSVDICCDSVSRAYKGFAILDESELGSSVSMRYRNAIYGKHAQ